MLFLYMSGKFYSWSSVTCFLCSKIYLGHLFMWIYLDRSSVFDDTSSIVPVKPYPSSQVIARPRESQTRIPLYFTRLYSHSSLTLSSYYHCFCVCSHVSRTPISLVVLKGRSRMHQVPRKQLVFNKCFLNGWKKEQNYSRFQNTGKNSLGSWRETSSK